MSTKNKQGVAGQGAPLVRVIGAEINQIMLDIERALADDACNMAEVMQRVKGQLEVLQTALRAVGYLQGEL